MPCNNLQVCPAGACQCCWFRCLRTPQAALGAEPARALQEAPAPGCRRSEFPQRCGADEAVRGSACRSAHARRQRRPGCERRRGPRVARGVSCAQDAFRRQQSSMLARIETTVLRCDDDIRSASSPQTSLHTCHIAAIRCPTPALPCATCSPSIDTRSMPPVPQCYRTAAFAIRTPAFPVGPKAPCTDATQHCSCYE
jgi:hypothetical protein